MTTGTYYLLVKDRTFYFDWSGPYTVRVCEGSCLRPTYLPLAVR